MFLFDFPPFVSIRLFLSVPPCDLRLYVELLPVKRPLPVLDNAALRGMSMLHVLTVSVTYCVIVLHKIQTSFNNHGSFVLLVNHGAAAE